MGVIGIISSNLLNSSCSELILTFLSSSGFDCANLGIYSKIEAQKSSTRTNLIVNIEDY